MKANLGAIDRAIRIIVVLLISVLIISHIVVGSISIMAFAILLFLSVTSLMSYCPFYSIFHLNTKKNLNDKAYASYRNQRQLN